MTKTFLLLPAVFCTLQICAAQDEARSPGWIVIPVKDYEALRGKAYPAETTPDATRVEATLTRVDYDLRIDGAIASGRASLTVDVLKDGWVRVPIPQGMLVREAKLNGNLVSIVPVPGRAGQLSAVLSRKGRSVLLLDVAFTISSAGGEERLSLPAGSSGVTEASIVLPSALGSQDVEVKLTGGFLPEKTGTRWLAYARGNEPLVFTWRKRTEERRVEMPLRMRSSLTQLFGLGEDSTSLSAEAQIDVIQGSATQMRLAVPDSVTINQVPGANVADWDVRNGELIVNFLDPVEHTVKFAINGETRLPRDGSIAIPLLRILDTERASDGVAVEVLGAGEIVNTKSHGLESAEASDLGAMVAARQSPSLAAFRVRAGSAERSLNIQVARYDQQALLTANIEEARYRVLMTVKGKTLVQARYAVRNNQRNFVRVTLPAGATVWSSSLGGRPVRPGQAEDGSLLLPLAKARAGEEAPPFVLEILYLAPGGPWGSKGRATLDLPILDLPISRTGVVIHHPPLFRVNADPGAFRTQSYESPVSEALTGRDTLVPSTPVGAAAAAPSVAQSLVDRYRAQSGTRKTAEALPIPVSFPTVGPSLFLLSELTGESKGAVITLNYQEDQKGGVK